MDDALRPGQVDWLNPLNLLFFGLHIATAILVVQAGVPTLGALAFCAGMYFLRMFAVTAGYHRYFSHRTFKTSRVFQFVLAFVAELSLQKGVLWWAAHHRHHHRFSDTEEDVHSPKHGFWWSHMLWLFSPRSHDTRHEQIKDFAKYPELRLLNQYLVWLGMFVALCALVLWGLGLQYLVWGCFVSTILVWHGTFTINSLSHIWGKRVYATSDTSRNNWILALITMGEGWHNNHHYYPSSCAQGFRWYQVDVTWRILWLLERVGIVWDIKAAPAEVVAGQLGRRSWLIADHTQQAAEETPPRPVVAGAPEDRRAA